VSSRPALRLRLKSLTRRRGDTSGFPGIVYVLQIKEDGTPLPVYTSPQIEALLGISAAEWESDPEAFARVGHPDDESVAVLNMIALKEGRPLQDFRMLGVGGEVLWMRPQASLFEEDGRFYMQGILHDITAEMAGKAERERLELELRLAQKLESVGQLAAGIAHEINTPVQFVGDSVRFVSDAIHDLDELLRLSGDLRAAIEAGTVSQELLARIAAAERDADLEYVRERVPIALARAQDGLQRVAEIVRAMQAFALPSTDGKAPADLNAALNNTLVVAASMYSEVADVERDLAPLPAVMCNVGELNQVFLNLIVNAAHAIEDEVGDSGVRGSIKVTSVVEGEQVAFFITDTGSGIDPDVAARVFDPFFTTKQVGRGTGQGLAISRTIITENHNGQISFTRNAEGGTTFVIRLAIDGNSPDSSTAQPRLAATTPTNPRE
jgi:signal transduction histidine kinase